MNIVLMAGGGGTRLWPLSRRSQPKQFLDFGTGVTLLEQALRRAKAVEPVAHIYVATATEYAERVRQLLPDIPVDHFFFEPERRDTTAAFAAVALRLVAAGAGEEPCVFLWCDHVFTNEPEFLNDLRKIPAVLQRQPDSMVLLAHTPITPETTLGYVETGEKAAGFDDVYHVRQFKEKPDLATAEKYLSAGNFFWNLGYFSLRPVYLLSELKRLAPEVLPALDEFARALQDNNAAAVDAAYSLFPKISIEYTFVEKTPRRFVITGDYGWNDVGNWAAVQHVFGQSGDHMPNGHHVHVDSNDNYVYNTTSKCVSLIGVKNTIVVVTGDAVLITGKHDAAKVKDVVKHLEEGGLKWL